MCSRKEPWIKDKSSKTSGAKMEEKNKWQNMFIEERP